MKTYIILNHGLCNIGGGQLYVNSKKKYMEEIGWRVLVFSYMRGEIVVDDLKQYKKLIFPELNFYPSYFFKFKRNKILQKMVGQIPTSDEIIIESNSTSLSCWGELLAARLNAKHIIYNLNESPQMKPELFPFFKFKLDRNEIAGITSKSVSNFFKGYLDVPESDDLQLKAYYSNKQVDDIPYVFPDGYDSEGKVTVGICGRLVKPFVMAAANGIKEFALNNPSMKLNVFFIGGDDPGTFTSRELKKVFSKVENVCCYITGFLYPIPLLLLKSLDFGISSSGAVRTLSREGVLTIAVDGNDNKPIGIFGITTNNSLYRTEEPIFDFQYWFNQIIIDKIYSDNVSINIEPYSDNSYLKLKSHMEFVRKTSKDRMYFINITHGDLLKKICLLLFNFKSFALIYKLEHVF